MVHHDCMLKVYKWMGIPSNVCRAVEEIMKKWKIRIEIHVDGKTLKIQSGVPGGCYRAN